MIDRLNKHLSLTRQCQLLGLSRSSLYYQPANDNTEDLALMALIDRQFLETPYYGSRKMTAWLRREGHVVNRKRVRRLMRQMGLQVIWQKPNTSQPNPEHKVYRKRGRRQTLRGGSLRARLNGPAHVDAWRLGCRKVMADQAAGAAV